MIKMIKKDYKNFHIEQGFDGIFTIIDDNGNQLCNGLGDICKFTTVKEAENYIDEYVI